MSIALEREPVSLRHLVERLSRSFALRVADQVRERPGQPGRIAGEPQVGGRQLQLELDAVLARTIELPRSPSR
jgi:hypothetical protein